MMHERLSSYIDSRKVSRTLISITTDISESKLSLLLSGKRRITIDEYENICHAMAVDPSYFFSSIDPHPTQY